MNIGDPNQTLAAVWIAGVLRDYRAAIAEASSLPSVASASKMVFEANACVDDAIKQFDAIMGDNLRIAENLSKINLPLNFIRPEEK